MTAQITADPLAEYRDASERIRVTEDAWERSYQARSLRDAISRVLWQPWMTPEVRELCAALSAMAESADAETNT